MINVITGDSGTGKSSLIHIVDYCLGSGKCSIPVGIIRETVEWFGVVLQLTDSQLLLARKNPEDKDQVGDYFVVTDKDIDAASLAPEKNANTEFIRPYLNELAGLPSVGFEPGNSSGFKGPASFRDLAAFNFQPQHIVANPHTLFFKTDTFEHREKLRTIFPLILGALTNEQLAAKHEIARLQAELEKRQALQTRQREAANSFLGEMRAFISRGQELGLLESNIKPESNWAAERLIEVLKLVPKRLADGILPGVDVGAANALIATLRRLEEEEDSLARDLSRASRRRLQIERLRASVGAYEEQLHLQEGKLVGVDWLANRIKRDGNCPFCGSENTAASEAVAHLTALARQVSQSATTAHLATPALEKEADRLADLTRDIETRLESVRIELWQLEDKSVEIADRRRTQVEAFRLAGRIEQALDLYTRSDSDSALANDVAALVGQIRDLRSIVDPAIESARLSGARQRLTQNTSRYVETLQLARRGDPVELDTDELMVWVRDTKGRQDALWEIGSAENWVGYHIATMLALHEEFLRLPKCPVPSFLMIDQPSQAYFPDRWPGDEEDGKASEIPSKDIAGVHRIFEALALGVERCKGQLQIIVIDHAGEITWKDVEGINLIGNWRTGKGQFLIPDDWQAT
jgi:hypothetical protein